MTTYRLFSYRTLRLTPEEMVEDIYFPWESISSEPKILTEDREVTITEEYVVAGESVTNVVTHIVPAGEIDPDWYAHQTVEHMIDLATLRFEDDTTEQVELEFFDDVDEEGTPFVNTREVTKKATGDLHFRKYVLCSEYCNDYHLPVRMNAKWEDVNAVPDQILREIYEQTRRVDVEKARSGDDSELNSLGLRNIDWENTTPTQPETPRSDRKSRAPGPAGGTNTEGIRE